MKKPSTRLRRALARGPAREGLFLRKNMDELLRDGYFLHLLLFERAVASVCRSCRNLIDHFDAFDDSAECSVVAVEERAVLMHDEELGTCRVRISGTCHGEYSTLVGQIILYTICTELTLDVTYTLTQTQDLRIDYKATTTKTTVINVANHNFFNLTGDHSSNILDEELWLAADSFAVYDMSKRVTGKLASVKGTPFDFRTPHLIGERIDASNGQLSITQGYDHCFKLNTDGDLSKLAARLVDNHTDITIEVYTTEPALQIYTANGHKGNMIGKNGKRHNRRNAVCFETMHFPDSPNNPQWPSTVLRPGETFRSTTIFHFN